MAMPPDNNATILTNELDWLRQVIERRLRLYFTNQLPGKDAVFPPPPAMKKTSTAYGDFVRNQKLNPAERLILILSLAPSLQPELLDAFFAKNTTYDKKFAEFGGITHQGTSFLPTVETALFLLGGTNLGERFAFYPLFGDDNLLLRTRAIKLVAADKDDPLVKRRLTVPPDYAGFFVTGEFTRPDFNQEFPARPVSTAMDWADMVLPAHTFNDVMEIKDWIEHGEALLQMAELGKRLKPGYKSLFYGPPGTGKTLTASLLGKSTGRDVYKIDLSLIVSKYIGETEKNLANVFDQAESKGWILFFDEADALFGKRTEIGDSHDRYANQEVAYLLQRIDDHNGVVILASNLKENIDQAFTRRFQSIIYFPMPGVEERLSLWKQAFSPKLKPAKDVDLRALAEKYNLSGGLMMNAVRTCSLKAIKNKQATISLSEIETAIRKELLKDGIILT